MRGRAGRAVPGAGRSTAGGCSALKRDLSAPPGAGTSGDGRRPGRSSLAACRSAPAVVMTSSENARFCEECGAAHEEVAPASREQRKTVTVRFCDVTGSTALGESTDPEALQRHTRPLLRADEGHRRVPRRNRGEVHRRRGHGRLRRPAGCTRTMRSGRAGRSTEYSRIVSNIQKRSPVRRTRPFPPWRPPATSVPGSRLLEHEGELKRVATDVDPPSDQRDRPTRSAYHPAGRRYTGRVAARGGDVAQGSIAVGGTPRQASSHRNC